ncbi:MAG: hypothetical protein D6772_02455 [Bacteroidetes bacterium]|nr:MAG: hypothetical protein D6772_02455 [Bacteroidota bacterium]
MAVFTLPQEMMPFFRHHLEYLTDHAVDPDKRRYATKHEAVRHYIDIDHWGTYPFPEVPRDWTDALLRYGELQFIRDQGDTLFLRSTKIVRGRSRADTVRFQVSDPSLPLALPLLPYRKFWQSHVLPQYYEDEWRVPVDTITRLLGVSAVGIREVKVVDHFSEYGIIPYHLERVQQELAKAFESKNPATILRVAAEFGHYIGDAHVPLHTTENYNGAMTNQIGIHAFWESRLPELFADETYDNYVGGAAYIADKKKFFWDAVLSSHALVDSVLKVEKRLSQTYPGDQQYCFEERLGRSVRTQCEAYAAAYHKAMGGMVEARWRAAIMAIGSAWFTAWVDAGQPDLRPLLGKDYVEDAEAEALNKAYQAGEAKGRPHEG